jgi:2,3-bisphosphoglycerate-independent phosphoglycerate mutase
MKYAIILPDGAADEPLEQLNGQTPLAAARTPNLDWIASHGQIGTVRTVPIGMSPGSDVATLSVIGYSPKDCYTGRAPIEAASRGISLGSEDIVFRCNLVTIADGKMEDFSAGHIHSEEGCRIIEDINRVLGSDQLQFYCGISYRNLMVCRNAGHLDVTTTPPHDIHGRPVEKYLPVGPDCEPIRDLMARSQQILATHEVNQVRRDLGENPATSIWLWGQGKLPRLPKFVDQFGLCGALIAAVDLVRGLGTLIGWHIIDVAGATGYLDTNYAGKGDAAVSALDEYDLVAVHVEAPDEAGHNGDVRAKVAALEQIDKHIVGPALKKLQTFNDWRVLVVPDHPTPIAKRTHTMDPPPFTMAGSRVHASGAAGFCEQIANASALKVDPGHELMEYFIKGG